MKPGKQNTFVFTSDNERAYYSRHVTGVRKNDIPSFDKQLKTAKVARQFVFNLSVFKSWEVVTPKVIKAALDHDTTYWKVDRITGDAKVTAELLELIERNWANLQEVWICAAVAGHKFPVMCQVGFARFCKEFGICDSHVQIHDIDRLFIGTNVEIEDQPGNPDRGLCRFEFFEVLIRIASLKYLETGQSRTLVSAF